MSEISNIESQIAEMDLMILSLKISAKFRKLNNQGDLIMATINEFLVKQGENNVRIQNAVLLAQSTIGGLKTSISDLTVSVTSLTEQVSALQNTPISLSIEDATALDNLLAQSTAIADQLTVIA